MTGAHARALAVLCLALTVVVVDNTILAVAFPSIEHALHTDESGLQWIGSAYGLVLAGLLLPLAVVADRRGRKGTLMIGLCIFGVGSAAAAFSTSTAMLVAARGAMGVGGACTMPATLSLLGAVFPEEQRGRAISVWSGVAGGATAAGPILGGLLLARFWWGSVFLVNVPITIIVLVLAALWLPRSTDPGAPTVDRGSALRWWGALTATIVAVIEGPQQGWLSPIALISAALAVVFFYAFARREARSPGPLVEQQTWHDPRLQWGTATMAALFFGVIGLQFVLTQWMQGELGESALVAGLYFVPMAVVSLLSALRNPRWVARFGHGRVAAGGLTALAVGAAIAGVAVELDNLAVAIVAGVFVGLGTGTASASGAELIMSSARRERVGSAAGVNETIVEAAGAVGIAVIGSVIVETSSFAWPMPLVAVVALGVAIGAWRSLTPRRASTDRSHPTPNA